MVSHARTFPRKKKLNHNYSVLWKSLDFFCFTLVGFLHLFLIILKLLMQIKDKIRKTRREDHCTEENMPMSSKEIKRFEDAE